MDAPSNRDELLEAVLGTMAPSQALARTSTRRVVRNVADVFVRCQVAVCCLHGSKSRSMWCPSHVHFYFYLI